MLQRRPQEPKSNATGRGNHNRTSDYNQAFYNGGTDMGKDKDEENIDGGMVIQVVAEISSH